ncbi:hypothetical protein YC2023_054272 [Brassica napus]|uniref:Uncharacterized protein n=1 Tax=Brassica oleracea TaxID=3712 RepID=A0A3P6CZV6_BRAOL|nr:unnamed protein product [Brassica oleracea]
MGRKELKPIANTRAPDGDFEDPEIAEQLRRSRNGCEHHGAACYKKRSTHKENTRGKP